MSQFVDLPVDEIVMDVDTQSRVSMDMELVETYADAMTAGDTFPAIVCFQEEGSNEPILADGWYRTMAAKQAGVTELLAEIHVGNIDDAIRHAAGANARHGLRRSNADKRKSVLMLLENEKWKGMSDRAIAEEVSVGKNTVMRVRKEQVVQGPAENGSGGTVIGKDGKHYPAKAAKKKEPSKKVERKALDVLKDMSNLYLELPRDPGEAVTEMGEGDGECLSAGRAEHMAWWLNSYAKIVKEYTEDEDLVITDARSF